MNRFLFSLFMSLFLCLPALAKTSHSGTKATEPGHPKISEAELRTYAKVKFLKVVEECFDQERPSRKAIKPFTGESAELQSRIGMEYISRFGEEERIALPDFSSLERASTLKHLLGKAKILPSLEECLLDAAQQVMPDRGESNTMACGDIAKPAMDGLKAKRN